MDSFRVSFTLTLSYQDASIYSFGNQYSDLGVLSEDGYGKIVGRIKDMIIRGGENVYPREIEEILHTHPSVQEAQVTSAKTFPS